MEPGEDERLKCGHGKKEMQNPDGILFSMPRETESMIQKILEVSQRRKPRETESTCKKSFKNMKDRPRHDENISDISMNSEKMHISTWTRFMASSMQAPLHIDPSYEKIRNFSRILNLRASKVMFGFTRMMIEGNSKIKNVFPSYVDSSLWVKPVLL